MPSLNAFSITAHDKAILPKAREYGCGLEIGEYMWDNRMEDAIAKRGGVSATAEGFSNLSLHGTAVNRDVCEIPRRSIDELLGFYDVSYQLARYHKCNKIVFHANYFQELETETAWFEKNASLWKRFLEDKPSVFTFYMENFVDDTPDMLAALCDAIDDPRFKICLDTGHAGCNSQTALRDWIKILGTRIGHVHLHNNDGVSDRHWTLGEGALDIAGALDDLLALQSVETIVLECDFEASAEWLLRNGFAKR